MCIRDRDRGGKTRGTNLVVKLLLVLDTWCKEATFYNTHIQNNLYSVCLISKYFVLGNGNLLTYHKIWSFMTTFIDFTAPTIRFRCESFHKAWFLFQVFFTAIAKSLPSWIFFRKYVISFFRMNISLRLFIGDVF